MRKTLLALAALLLLAVLAGGAWVAREAHTFLHTPPAAPGEPVTVDIPRGATFAQVARQLEDKGVVADARYFRLLGRWREALADVQAGEFQLHTGWVPDKVLETLVSGRPVLYRLSLREGLTWWETARAVEEAGFATYEAMAEAVHDPVLLARHSIPFDSAEGYLFPETYHLRKPDTPEQGDARAIVDLLVETFFQRAATLWPDGLPDAATLANTVSLASVVEKETGNPSERRRVAGVFANRLERRMRLQSCVTVIYGLGREFDGNLKKKHLENPDNPYNTYRHGGLPPGPVCSPGLEALRAAADPEEHKYLYFVAKGDGTHHYSRTLTEHNRAVNKYQLHRH
jgi:UPF0755 protein